MCYTKDRSIHDRREMLRVKLKSLSEEARIIRHEQRRVGIGPLEGELHWHRVGPLRQEARATHLAYGLVRGRALERIEVSKTRDEQLWKKVRAMVERYGPVEKALRTSVLERCQG